jgi:hypothetical protein
MIFIIFFAGLIADLALPCWWSIVPISFAAAFLFRRGRYNLFWTAFLANALLWLLFILYRTIPNGDILVQKISAMYRLPHWSLLIILIVFIGGLLSGISAICGAFFRDLAFKNHNQ